MTNQEHLYLNTLGIELLAEKLFTSICLLRTHTPSLIIARKTQITDWFKPKTTILLAEVDHSHQLEDILYTDAAGETIPPSTASPAAETNPPPTASMTATTTRLPAWETIPPSTASPAAETNPPPTASTTATTTRLPVWETIPPSTASPVADINPPPTASMKVTTTQL
ncbi:glycoprotein gp100-like [Schistocerca serialis cubense]|uniref:glycoprotein gp100-like n=1 Tax=Schistocerca serialis cubense TaxID=2023355 RepID=UPI00214E1AC8|nr:glycoprotein gp100-like [Schistocerca serialis cubense]